MKSISYSVSNLRRLKDTPLIEIKPITILVGRNSIGKSTFLRSLPLLDQSLNTESSAPVLWFGNRVDFGDYKTALCKTCNKNFIGFHFEISDLEINIEKNKRKYTLSLGRSFHEDARYSFGVTETEGKTHFSYIETGSAISGSSLKIDLDSNPITKSAYINGTPLEDIDKKFKNFYP